MKSQVLDYLRKHKKTDIRDVIWKDGLLYWIFSNGEVLVQQREKERKLMFKAVLRDPNKAKIIHDPGKGSRTFEDPVSYGIDKVKLLAHAKSVLAGIVEAGKPDVTIDIYEIREVLIETLRHPVIGKDKGIVAPLRKVSESGA